MPTILRFRNFRIFIYTEDHVPPHVHVLGPDKDAVYYLLCPEGSVAVREYRAMRQSELTAIAKFLTHNLQLLCTAWEGLHGDTARA